VCTSVSLVHGTSVDDLAADRMSVHELMRLDTALAVVQARNRLHSHDKKISGTDTHELVAQSGALKLVAIYGVGKKLLAEVKVGARPYLYMRGHSMPVGVKTGADVFQLKGISGTCVQLERKAESHTLCLHPQLWEGR